MAGGTASLGPSCSWSLRGAEGRRSGSCSRFLCVWRRHDPGEEQGLSPHRLDPCLGPPGLSRTCSVPEPLPVGVLQLLRVTEGPGRVCLPGSGFVPPGEAAWSPQPSGLPRSVFTAFTSATCIHLPTAPPLPTGAQTPPQAVGGQSGRLCHPQGHPGQGGSRLLSQLEVHIGLLGHCHRGDWNLFYGGSDVYGSLGQGH